ncbi:anti-sigma factor family protein [Streptomyces sp. NPDC091272]|uniref:anti-sigma factor family protein n=1 Tax=Streptomyces sp. NPDC091272 TaxID=3365981 RepID=UPI0038009A83
MNAPGSGSVHDAVAAYSLGILDEAEAAAFETHLALCALCAGRLDDLAGLEPVLAALREPPGPPRESTPPRPALLEGLLAEVAAGRELSKRRKRRGTYLAAAAALVVIGGSGAAVVAADSDRGAVRAAPEPHPTGPAEDAFLHHMEEKRAATDPRTHVAAVVGTERKGWGTHTVLELTNVKGPLRCSLVAVSKQGEEEVVSSWSVPRWGYGIADSPRESARAPLYVHGGAAMSRNDIDHFEVRTFDGRRLVQVGA